MEAPEALALDGVDLEEISGEIFSFLPNPDLEDVAEGEAGPGQSTTTSRTKLRHTFIDNTNSRTYQWHPTTEKVFGQEPVMQACWQSLFSREDSSGNSKYKPFSGRLDWELAQWAMQEKISHRSFDCLLKIPQVVKECLNLSYSNSRSMLQQVDALPERCGKWYTKQFPFKDLPEEYFTVCYRDPTKAIRGLWGDPAFVNDIIYKPAKMFWGAKQTEEEQIYSEMWTSGFWNAAQVGLSVFHLIYSILKASSPQFLREGL
ncbi:hypothetical protein GGU11DRAFT_693978 [Lentinula aff. detonsa]|nr:hypothetical protein GGU11DRAFT_693978 [Lentinula aff. detonsa]